MQAISVLEQYKKELSSSTTESLRSRTSQVTYILNSMQRRSVHTIPPVIVEETSRNLVYSKNMKLSFSTQIRGFIVSRLHRSTSVRALEVSTCTDKRKREML